MKTRVRRGFTLPEILVTVTVVAVLAAVVVPAVVQQVGKGDVGQLSSDLKSAQTAVNNFATDVRAFPAYFAEVGTAIANSDTALDGSVRRTFSDPEVSRWKGPYGGSAADSIMSGFGIVIGGATYDTITVASKELLVSAHASQFNTSNGNSLLAPIARADSLVDGATGSTKGMIRWTAVGTDSAKNVKVVVGVVP